MNELRLSIACHPIGISIPDDDLFQAAQERYGGFLTDDVPETRFTLGFPARLQKVADAGVPWALCAADPITFGRNDLVAETDGTFHDVRVEMRNLVYTLDAMLRIFYSVFLIRHGGVLLHAASVGVGGVGLLFAGPTESGKSELSHMEYGIHLTDELTPVRAFTDGYTVHGSPFWGLFEQGGHNVGLPLRAAFFLSRGSTSLEPLSRIQALQRLLRCVLNFSKEPAVIEQAVTTCGHVLLSVPFTGLVSPPDAGLWSLVTDFLSARSPAAP